MKRLGLMILPSGTLGAVESQSDAKTKSGKGKKKEIVNLDLVFF